MPDPRLHGPEKCPRTCSECSGRHHWIDTGFDPTCEDPDDEMDDGTARAVLDYDRRHGTEHALAYFACKHCPAWAECDYVWELEEDAEDEA